MKYPKISVVTINFNGAVFLEDSIRSVLDQKYPNLEYIIVDGGSTDGSVDIIKKYRNQLAFWISEPDKGMYYALQKGFEKSSGEIMAWLNSDDMYHPRSLFTVAEIFSSLAEVSWLEGATTKFDKLGRTVYVSQSKGFTKYHFYNYDYKWIQQESVFWRRSLWVKAGACFDLKLKYAGDFELWLRFFKYEKLYVTPALIGGFRKRTSNQISIDHLDDYLDEVRMLINSVKLESSERHILSRYQKLCKIVSLFDNLKIFKAEVLKTRFRGKYFPKFSAIYFDSKNQEFFISK